MPMNPTPIFSPPITVEDIMSMKHEEEPPALISADRIPQFSPCIQLCGGNDDHHTAADIDESEYNEQRNIDMTINLLRQQHQQQRRVQRPVSPSKSSDQEEGSSILDSISSFIESVQVCGLYICGFGRATQEDDVQKDAKDERKEGIDDTFMGKVISCPANSCGRTSQSAAAADEIDISDNIRIAYIRSSTSIHSELSEL